VDRGRRADNSNVPHTLLLADDSVTIQRVIELTFADEDVQVTAVDDGDQAIAALDANPPDIVLADVGMPGKSGYEVARYMKRHPHLAHIPILLLTGAFEPVDQAAAAEAGCDGVLAKPFEPQLVISRVRELLAQPRPPAAVVHGPGAEAPPAPISQAPAQAARAETPSAAAPKIIDEYFDRLDQAFATVASRRGDAAAPAPPPPVDSAGSRGRAGEQAAPPQRPHVPPPRPAPETPSRTGVAFPPLADAFSALLAAEQHAPSAGAAPTWPVAPPPPPVVPITDELIDEVTRRVMDRLSDRVVRETVSEIVSAVAERLIRDEIDKIKAAIR
jgi:CheY-like chemotaxis protein